MIEKEELIKVAVLFEMEGGQKRREDIQISLLHVHQSTPLCIYVRAILTYSLLMQEEGRAVFSLLHFNACVRDNPGWRRLV